MFDYQISFDSPWYLALLALVPAVWWFSLRRLVLLGRVRKLLVLGLRSVVLAAIVVALAGLQMVRISDRLTVIYLVDQSLSIPAAQRRAMIEYVNAAIREHRRHRDDKVGAIVFGRDAAVEIPPFDDNVQLDPLMESLLDRDYTNLAGALKLAHATFPEDTAKRIVVVSDGNENLGDAVEQARGASGAGVGIDVVPVYCESRSEVILEGLAAPGDVRQGEPFDLTVVVNNTTEPTAEDPGEISGKLVLKMLSRESGGEAQVLDERRVVLPPGRTVFTLREEISAADFYRYEAEFFPDTPGDDARQNNMAPAFVHVRGAGQVLLIEDHEQPGEFDQLVRQLRKDGLEVTVQPADQLFVSQGELLRYDTVLLANVPREYFSDPQIKMLVGNTQQMAGGLVMLGGPNSFGAGGWAGTELEKAMPVDFQIKSAKAQPKGALVMMMHACEIPQGNHWQKVVAHAAIKVLGPQDYCGVLFYGTRGTDWLWTGGVVRVGSDRNRMMGFVDRMTPGDMPDFDPAMQKAVAGFRSVPDAAVKHMIVISDGDPAPPSNRAIQNLLTLGVTISTVSIGDHSAEFRTRLQNLARQGGGTFYLPRSAKALPSIFQREARRVARPLIYEQETPWRVQVRQRREILGEISSLPPITGFVMTSKKENPLVETPLVSPQPAGEENSTILACWSYGLGKAVAFTTDAGARWTQSWPDSAEYGPLFSKMVRWSMRPTEGSGKFTVATEVKDEQVRLVVNALDENDNYQNFLPMTAEALGPELEPIAVELRQTAPGRYEGVFPTQGAGSYYVAVNPGLAGEAPIFTGVSVPYSDEFRNRGTNEGLLIELAGMTPEGGKPGQVIEAAGDPDRLEALLAVDTFRHGDLAKATSSQDIWFYVVLIGCWLFFLDVFFRRVQVNLAWVGPLAGRVLRRRAEPARVEMIDRLRSRKAEVTGQIERLRTDARFEPSAEKASPLEEIEPAAGPGPGGRAAPPIQPRQEPDEESYTERLLRAKKKVWDDHGKDKK